MSAPHSLAEREVEALEKIADRAITRNQLHGESIDLQRQHLRFMLDAEAHQRELGGKIIEDIRGAVLADKYVESISPAGATAGGPWFVLRDPSTAPSSWINQVKVAHLTRQDAAEEADRMARKHGGRFLVLGTTAYVEPASPTFREGSPPDLTDLPF